MSLSHKFADALMLGKVLKRKVTLADIPASKGFNPKPVLIQCRRCKGLGTEQDSPANCPQCGGRGVEKVSEKAFINHNRRALDAKP